MEMPKLSYCLLHDKQMQNKLPELQSKFDRGIRCHLQKTLPQMSFHIKPGKLNYFIFGWIILV